jgi:hypothetical protein
MSSSVADFSPLLALSTNDLEVWAVIAFALIGVIGNLLKKIPKKPPVPGQTGPAERTPTSMSRVRMLPRPAGLQARPSAETHATSFEPALYRRPAVVQRKPARAAAVVSASPVVPVQTHARPMSLPASIVSRVAPDAVAPRMQQLLHDKTSLQAAFMLSELLAPPLSLREEHRP